MPLFIVIVNIADIKEDELNNSILNEDINIVLISVEVDDAISTLLIPLIYTLGLIFTIISRE